MTYRVTHRFVRLEALGNFGQNGRYNDPADPQGLEVRVTDAHDLTAIVESVDIRSQLPNRPFRIATGIWGFDLNAPLYQAGRAYTVHWRYEMTPGNLKVDRYNFVWNPTPAMPRLDANCVVHGTIADLAGNPMNDVRVAVEQYKDAVTLTHRLSTIEIVSDCFGNWFIEVPRGNLLRFVYGDLSKTIIVPDQARIALSDAVDYQPDDVRKDRFGYPMP